MNHLKNILAGCLLVFLALGGAGRVLAQDQPQEPPQQPPESEPQPAGRSTPIPAMDSGDVQDVNPNQGNEIQPDDTPLTGMLSPTLGAPAITHSYWVAGLQYAASIQSTGYGSSDWFAYNYFGGNFSLLQAWSHSKFVVNYTGGGYFDTSGGGAGSFQRVSLAQTFTFRRWNFQIADSFSYLPQSNYGFGGGTNLGTPGIGASSGTTLPGVTNGFVPNQSLYGGLGPQYNNVGVIQGTYALSARSQVTASAAYGILNFINSGYVDSNSLYAGFGYSYKLTPKDSIGVVYNFGSYHFPGDPQAYGSQIVSLAYSRKITGRVALSLYGGPQYTSFRVPIGTATSQLGGYASASLSYALENGGLSVSYSHGLSGGGGLLTGSILDQVYFGASRKLTRIWEGHVNFGYAHNATIISSATIGNPNYSSWYAGGGLHRPFGRYIDFGFAYTASISTYNLNGNCPGTTCGPASNSLYQTVTANIQWRTRPMVLR
jgi:hypothetical protein